MEKDGFARLVKLISGKTGLRLDVRDNGTLRKAASARMAVHGFSSPEQYIDLLEADTGKGRLERGQLISLLTVGESYFFRDKGQFDLLKNNILPELIERRQAARTLNIWSAGCSTGEEPYSLAILLHEAIPDMADWRVLIVGTDIKEEFLEKAKKAVYSEWSFRMVPGETRNKYFKEKGGRFHLDPVIKNMVTFRQGDLLDDMPSPANEPGNMDLILCRNVFIYYQRKTTAAIVAKIAGSLREGGYLITGHWELFSPPSGLLLPRMFPESLAYQRIPEGSIDLPVPYKRPFPPTIIQPQSNAVMFTIPPSLPAAEAKMDPPNIMAEAENLFKSGAYRDAVAWLEKELRKTPGDCRALCLAAHSYANLGEHGRAVECLRKAIDVNPLSAEPYFLLARIAEENGDTVSARANLGKVIYLEPASVAAYLDLAAIHDGSGEPEKARKMRVAALEVLRQLPEESIVEPYGTTVAEFVRHMELLL